MNKIIILSMFLALAACRPGTTTLPSDAKDIDNAHVTQIVPLPSTLDYEKIQNANAKYSFSTNIEDHINDQTQTRTEHRDGLRLVGSYSYSDGYFKRTVHYIADQNGYRVVSQEAVPLKGPHVDLNGIAKVHHNAHGTQLRYVIQSVPAPVPVPLPIPVPEVQIPLLHVVKIENETENKAEEVATTK